VKIGDLVSYGTMPHWKLEGCLGILVRKLQWNDSWIEGINWDGDPAWWIQYVGDEAPTWNYEEELTLVRKGN
tara:strand:+ start:309 stop:524 length:216 start_codon:yes stop_codon:yes gene_type:complete